MLNYATEPEKLTPGFHYKLLVEVMEHGRLVNFREMDLFVGSVFVDKNSPENYVVHIDNDGIRLKCIDEEGENPGNWLYVINELPKGYKVEIIMTRIRKYTDEDLEAHNTRCKIKNTIRRRNEMMNETKKIPEINVEKPIDHVMIYPNMGFTGYIQFNRLTNEYGSHVALCIKKLPNKCAEEVSKDPDAIRDIDVSHGYTLHVGNSNANIKDDGESEDVKGRVRLDIDYSKLNEDYNYWIALCPYVESEETKTVSNDTPKEDCKDIKPAETFGSPATDRYGVIAQTDSPTGCYHLKFNKHEEIKSVTEYSETYLDELKSIKHALIAQRKATKELRQYIGKASAKVSNVYSGNPFSHDYELQDMEIDTTKFIGYTIEIIDRKTGTIVFSKRIDEHSGIRAKIVTLEIDYSEEKSLPFMCTPMYSHYVEDFDNKRSLVIKTNNSDGNRYFIRVTGFKWKMKETLKKIWGLNYKLDNICVDLKETERSINDITNLIKNEMKRVEPQRPDDTDEKTEE